MAYDLTARLRLIDDLSKPLQKVTKNMGGIGKIALGVSSAIAGIGAALGGVAVVASSVNKAMDFEAQMDSVASLDTSIAKGTAGYARMQALALEMGAKTKYSALQAAQGMEELVKAGLSVEQIDTGGGLEAALNLATAGGLDLAEAAEIMSTSLNAFRSNGLSAADAANILAGTANASATGVHELRYSLAQVSAVADGVGMTFRDTNIALGLFANNGLKGSDAGTSLKTMLGNLQPGTKKQMILFEKLGIVTKDGANRFFDAAGNLKDLESIAGILQSSLKGLTNQQRSAALEAMFGSDAVRAGNIIFKEGAEGVKKFSGALASAPTALQVATAKMDNAKGAIEMFDGAMETLQIAALLPTMPLIKKVALAAADMAGKMTEWLASDQAKAWGNAIQSEFTRVKTIFGGIGKLFEGDYSGGFQKLFGAGLSGDQVGFITSMVNAVKDAVAQIQQAAEPLSGYFEDSFGALGGVMQSVGAAMAPVFPAMVQGIAALIVTLMQLWTYTAPVRDALASLVTIVASAFASQWPGILSTVQTVWAGLQPIFNLFKVIMGVLGTAIGVMADVWAYIWPDIMAIINKVAPPISRLIGNIAENIGILINTFVKPLLPVLGSVLKSTWDIIKPILNFLIDLLVGVVDAINDVIEGGREMALQLGKIKDIKIGAPEWMGGNGLIQMPADQPSSHASGISNVPYNGYLARLHKGEQVLTPEDAQANRNGVGGATVTFGDIHINGASGNMEDMADQFMTIVARRIAEAGGQM